MIYSIFILIALFISWIYYRKTTPELSLREKLVYIAFRTIALSVILLYLFNPIYTYSKRFLQADHVVILNDISDSMDAELNDYSKNSIIAHELEKLERALEEKSYEVTTLSFANGIDGAPNSTSISKTLDDLNSRVDLNKVKELYLFSDGWFQDNNYNDIIILNKPINSYIYEYTEQVDSLKIVSIDYNDTCFLNETSPFEINIESSVKTKANCSMLVDGVVVSAKEVDVKADQLVSIEFEYKFHNLGIQTIDFVVSKEGTEELHADATVRVIKAKDKVMLVSDALNWETKQIKDALKNNARFSIEVLQAKHKRLYSGNQLIRDEVKLSDYSLMILVNNGNLKLSNGTIQILTNRLIAGSSIILIGEPVKGLEQIQAMKSSQMSRMFEGTLNLTSIGKSYSVFSNFQAQKRNIPPVKYKYYSLEHGSEILATFDNQDLSPAISLKKSGTGLFLHFGLQNLWKWSLWDEENSYGKTIENLANWLSNNQDKKMLLSASKPSYLYGEKVELQFQAFDEKLERIYGLNPLLKIVNSEGSNIDKNYMIEDDDLYSATVENLKPGVYSAIASIPNMQTELKEEFIVKDTGVESMNLGFNLENLKYISAITRGASFTDVTDVPIVKAKTERIAKEFEIHLYKKVWLLVIFLIAFSVELLLRRRKGLI